jgi:hypothetical protein
MTYWSLESAIAVKPIVRTHQEPELPMPRAPAETNEQRQARLRAAADKPLENAERGDARSADDWGEPREWDTRSADRKPARRKTGIGNAAPKGIIKK